MPTRKEKPKPVHYDRDFRGLIEFMVDVIQRKLGMSLRDFTADADVANSITAVWFRSCPQNPDPGPMHQLIHQLYVQAGVTRDEWIRLAGVAWSPGLYVALSFYDKPKITPADYRRALKALEAAPK